MHALVERYPDDPGVLVLFFENKDDEYAIARAGFDKLLNARGWDEPWTGSFTWSDGPGTLMFGFTPGQQLSEAVTDRDKRVIGLAGWMLLEEAYALAFPKQVKRNPSRRRR